MKKLNSRGGNGFTLVEILVVIIIIAILAGLVFSVAGNVMSSARKSRAAGEVAALDAALTRFQVDNGFFPSGTNVTIKASGGTNYYFPNPNANLTVATNSYATAGRILFLALMGRTTYDYTGTNTNNYRQYYTDLKANQVANSGSTNANGVLDPTIASTYTTNSFASGSYLIDPFQNPYGYYYNVNVNGWDAMGDVSLYNRTAPDVWSTAGETNSAWTTAGTAANTYLLLRWIHNWPQNASP